MTALETEEIIQNTNSTATLIDEGILHFRWHTGIELEIPDIDEAHRAFELLAKGRKVKVLSEFGHYVNISPEARDYAAHTCLLYTSDAADD